MKHHTLDLSLSLAKAQFKVKNEGSYLGILWYLLNPLLLYLLLIIVFSQNIGKDIPHYPLYLLVGIIMFNYFRMVTTMATRTIYENRYIIKSINFPRESLVCSSVLSALFSHFFEMAVVGFFFLFFGIPLYHLLYYLILLILFVPFLLGVSLFLSALTVFFFDLQHIWVFISHLLWFATPIFYSLESHPQLLIFNLVNPLYYFLTAARLLLIQGVPPPIQIVAGAAGWTTFYLLLGLFVFRKLRSRIPENV